MAYYLSAFKMKLEYVKVNIELEGLNLRCITHTIFSSAVIFMYRAKIVGPELKGYALVKECINLCFPKSEDPNIDQATCLLNCYDERIRNRSIDMSSICRTNELRGLLNHSLVLFSFSSFSSSVFPVYDLFFFSKKKKKLSASTFLEAN
jgi:hypothetical protein